MNRVWDYAGFIVWFMGLGTVVLWLAGLFGHPMLPPVLALIGLTSASFVAVRLLLLAIARWRVPFGIARAAAAARAPAAVIRPPLPKPVRSLPTVKPRDHFGLRGNKQETVP
jgi:hypothetical protein